MKDNFGIYDALDGMFAGTRESVLTLDEFLTGLEGRSYAFAILALNIPNIIPTGIPWLSTITGVPMLLLLVQFFAGRSVPERGRQVQRRRDCTGRRIGFGASVHRERFKPHLSPPGTPRARPAKFRQCPFRYARRT